MSNSRPFHSSFRICQSETEISNLFERHTKALSEKKWKMFDEIIEWKNDLIHQIEENAAKQKHLVEQEYENQLHDFGIKRQEFLDTALIYEERKDREQVRQLIEQCHALNFELATFEYSEQSILFIQIKKDKQSTKIKRDSSNIHQIKDEKSTINDNFTIMDRKNVHTTTIPKTTFVNSNKINQQSLTTSSSTGYGNRNSNYINNDDMVEKCPACFIIFPPAMKAYERLKHVNEHFGDP